LQGVLAKLGLAGLRFGKEKNGNNKSLQDTLVKSERNDTNEISSSKNNRTTIEGKKSNLISNSRPLVSSGRRLNKNALLQE